eukprot:754451-Hanusia_phi.AAC.1
MDDLSASHTSSSSSSRPQGFIPTAGRSLCQVPGVQHDCGYGSVPVLERAILLNQVSACQVEQPHGRALVTVGMHRGCGSTAAFAVRAELTVSQVRVELSPRPGPPASPAAAASLALRYVTADSPVI